jgi:hypothetical protein
MDLPQIHQQPERDLAPGWGGGGTIGTLFFDFLRGYQKG